MKVKRHGLILFLVILLLVGAGCGKPASQTGGYDTNDSVPSGDPPFTPLTTSWVIDNAGVLKTDVIKRGDAICQQLQNDGIAEIVVLIQNGVKHPEDYATHYGRWLKLGRRGMSTEGGNNGFVWLIRPDHELKVTPSRGRGLPKFTASHEMDVINKAIDYLNFNNFDQGVLILLQETDKALRELYQKKGEQR